MRCSSLNLTGIGDFCSALAFGDLEIQKVATNFHKKINILSGNVAPKVRPLAAPSLVNTLENLKTFNKKTAGKPPTFLNFSSRKNHAQFEYRNNPAGRQALHGDSFLFALET
jgi:hypothetical protein